MIRPVRLPPVLCLAFCGLIGLIIPVATGGARLLHAADELKSKPGTLPLIADVERQPLVAATERLIEALKLAGTPLSAEADQKLQALLKETDAAKCVTGIQQILDPLVLAMVTVNAESRVSAVEGPARKQLIHQGWQTFLIKVHNQAGINPELKLESPNIAPLVKRSTGSPKPAATISPADVEQRFLDAVIVTSPPLKPGLSGLVLEYRLVQLYSRAAGQREAQLGFHVGQGTQDLAFRNSVPILFDIQPAVTVKLQIRDFDGQPTTAALVIRDRQQRVYPNPARRLAPDFFFHNQIYRADGETVFLPPGEYAVELSRGPEYLVETFPLTVKNEPSEQSARFELRRWIHPAKRQWFSGDHHVHAAGCAHYESPTEGVTPQDMLRHILGEDLNVGCVLSWGPCWYSQKKYFDGKVSALSRPDYLMRYDVEVSGFPSSHAGHLCLLRLTEDDYEGTTQIEEWPSWTQPILAWGRKQGGIVGYSHSGWGIALPDINEQGERVPVMKGRAADRLPDYAMPPFDGIGANEYIVTAANDVCDFISAVDTPAVWELNIWYHTLNCGLRSRISGETDFPCIYGDKVGLGRIYVKLPADERLTYDTWVQGLKAGRSYCGDGLSHLLDFQVNGLGVGELPSGSKKEQDASVLKLAAPGKVKVTFDAAALLAEKSTPETEAIRTRRLDQKPYWHLERCRIPGTREVPVELIVNGLPVAKKNLAADGHLEAMTFDVELKQSSWVAVRIFPSVHTNPVFVEIGGQPIRASRKSADWCRKAVDVCWNAKQKQIRASERPAAQAAYDQARRYYEQVQTAATQD